MGSPYGSRSPQSNQDLIVDMVDWSEIDLIVSVEAMGLPLLAAVGEATGKPTVVIRKRSYGMEGEVRVDVQQDTQVRQLTLTISNPEKGSWYVDDVISTGGLLSPPASIEKWEQS